MELKHKAHEDDDEASQHIASDLRGGQAWARVADGLAGDKVSELRNHAYVACHELGLETDHMLWLIE